MWLVVGLGNPGLKYRDTRHNVGWKVLELLAERSAAPPLREKWRGLTTKTSIGGEDVALLAPQTFMNLSGESVVGAMAFYKLAPADIIVLHDEIDLPFGDVRVKVGGGAAGHNGLRSLIQHCGGPDFIRVRIGVGRPPHGTTESWVLGNFDGVESASLGPVLEAAALAAETVVKEGPPAAQNKINRRAPKPAG